MYRLILTVGLFLATISGFGQSNKLDSLLNVLPQTSAEQRVIPLHEIVKSAWTSDPNQVVDYGREAINLSLELRDLRLISISYRIYGGLCNYMSQIDSGKFYKLKALEIAIELNDSTLLASSYNNLGVTAQTLGNYVEALSYYYTAYLISKSYTKITAMPVILSNISEVYYDLQEYDSAILYAQKAVDISSSQQHSSHHLLALNTLARAELATNNYQKARGLYNSILELSEVIGDKRYAGYAYQGLGKMFVNNESKYPAKKHLFKALAIFQTLDDETYISEVYRDMGLLMISNNTDSSHYYIRKSLGIAQNLMLQDIILSNYNILIDLYTQENNVDSLQLYQSLSRSMEASIRKKNNLNSIEGMFAKIRDEGIRKKLAEQTITLQRKTFQTNFFVAFAILTSLFSLMIYRYYRKQKRLGQYLREVNQQVTHQNELIDSKNKELRALDDEKNDLIQIVAHDLKNPLSNIISASQLINKQTDQQDATLLDVIEGSATRLSTMITKILDVEAIDRGLSALKLQSVDLSTMVNNVCNDLENQAKNKSIILNRDITEGVTIIAEPTYLFQIMENLLSNALKFSPENRNVYILLKCDK